MPSARNSDPSTSHEAAASMQTIAAEHHAQILRTLRTLAAPMSAEEIADAGHFADKVAVCKRFAELERLGCIIKTDIKARNRSGRRAYRYVAA
jgi:predicted transcriptional regulator